MKTVVDERLRDEAKRFSLKHRCDDCVHGASDNTCANMWPTEEHRLPIADNPIVVFCKEFEGS